MRYLIHALFFLASGLYAQNQDLMIDQEEMAYDLSTGPLRNDRSLRSVVFDEVIHITDATWLRLVFDEAILGKAPANGAPTVLRITSLADGAVQHLNTLNLKRWRHTSAYFNGDSVLLEILADSGAAPSQLSISRLWAGPPNPLAAKRTICGPTDDRELSNDPRSCRGQPVQCSIWLIDDANHCLLTAGHCSDANFISVVEFNVPASDPTGASVHPGPEDQYPTDPDSLQYVNGGTGNDWSYFGAFPNSETGLTPVQAQGDYYELRAPPAAVTDQVIRITGYGTTSPPVPPPYNRAQKTHTGLLTNLSGSIVEYATDTTGGNSGSPIILEDDGTAIGIHTHGGCFSSGGDNLGTASTHVPFQAALANPLGICVFVPGEIDFVFPEGLPETLDPAGATIRVEVVGINGGAPLAGSGMLHYASGLGPMVVPMAVVAPNVYDATFPAFDCLDRITYSFSAQSVAGQTAETAAFDAVAALNDRVHFNDTFETNMGWTVTNDAGLSQGAWERGTPAGGQPSAPAMDADNSGACFLTGIGASNVDGGHTVLTSPALDARGDGDTYLVYWRWFDNHMGSIDDQMVVEMSADGSSWTNVETLGPFGPENKGGWVQKIHRIADYVTPTQTFFVRFDVEDSNLSSLVEAAIDGVRLVERSCIQHCPFDLNSDLTVDEGDFQVGITLWPTPQLDLNGDASGNVIDLLELRASFGECGANLKR